MSEGSVGADLFAGRKMKRAAIKFSFGVLILLLAGVSRAACTSPAAVAGTFQTVSGSYQYCNGTSWIPMKYGGLALAATLTETDTTKFTSPTAVAIAGSYAYVAATSTTGTMAIAVMNISSINAPTLTTTVVNSAEAAARNIITDGSYLYVQTSAKLLIYSIATPAAPSLVGSVAAYVDNGTAPLFILGSYLYEYSGLQNKIFIINITTKSAPTISGSLTDATNLSGSIYPRRISVVGNYLYAPNSNNNGLTIIDITNKAAPVFSGSVTSVNMTATNGVVVSGNYAYVICNQANALAVVDITSKTAPVYLSRITSSTTMERPSDIILSGTALYVSQTAGRNDATDYINKIDISTPTAPTIVATGGLISYTGTTRNIDAFDLSGNSIVAVESAFSLIGTFNITSGLTTAVADKMYPPRISSQFGGYLSGNYFFSYANGPSITVIDVTSPTTPAIYSSLADLRSVQAKSMTISGSYMFLSGGADYGFHAYNISNPASVSWVSSLNSYFDFADTSDIKVSGSYAYLAVYGQSKFVVVNVATPATMSVAGSIASLPIYRLDVSGTYAYTCGNSNNTFNVINIATPTAPTVAATLVNANFNDCQEIKVSGSYAYLYASTPKKLSVIDISVPTAPTVVGTYTEAATSSGGSIAVSGNYVYMAYYNGGHSIVDVTTKTAPVRNDYVSGFISTFGEVVQSGSYLYEMTGDAFKVFYAAPLVTQGACTVSGELKYITANNVLAYCNGTSYIPSGPSPGAGGAGCTTPTNSTGAVYYNTTSNKLQYCNGTSWVSVN